MLHNSIIFLNKFSNTKHSLPKIFGHYLAQVSLLPWHRNKYQVSMIIIFVIYSLPTINIVSELVKAKNQLVFRNHLLRIHNYTRNIAMLFTWYTSFNCLNHLDLSHNECNLAKNVFRNLYVMAKLELYIQMTCM